MPRVIFAVGDADDAYTEHSVLRLIARLQQQSGWDVVGYTNKDYILEEMVKLGVEGQLIPMDSPGIKIPERLQAVNEMVEATRDVIIPGSDLHLWKLLALDDFVGTLMLFGTEPDLPLEADLVIMPILGIGNTTVETCGLYTWLFAKAREQGIPTMGIEVDAMGNKHTMSHLPFDHYMVKTKWARDVLIAHGKVRPEQVSLMRREEAYLCTPGQDSHTEIYLQQEAKVREIIRFTPDQFIVFIPHHLGFLWETKRVLAALAKVPWPVSVVIKTEKVHVRRQYTEQEICLLVYEPEMKTLGSFVVDEKVGVGLLVQYANLVITCFSGVSLEEAIMRQIPTIVCQRGSQSGWQTNTTYWEPNQDNLPELILGWWKEGILNHSSLHQIAEDLMGIRAEPEEPQISQINGEDRSVGI